MIDTHTKNKLIREYKMMSPTQTDVILVQNIKDNNMVVWTTEEELDDPAIKQNWIIIGWLKQYKRLDDLKKQLKEL